MVGHLLGHLVGHLVGHLMGHAVGYSVLFFCMFGVCVTFNIWLTTLPVFSICKKLP